MKRETLVELGLDQETIKIIMAEHGKSVTTLKNELATKQNELDSLKTEHDSLKTEIETKSLQEKKEFAIRHSMKEAASFDDDLVMGLIDLDKITFENNELKGLDEQIEVFKKEKPFLFKQSGNEDKKTNQVTYNPLHGNDAKTSERSEAFGSISEKYK